MYACECYELCNNDRQPEMAPKPEIHITLKPREMALKLQWQIWGS